MQFDKKITVNGETKSDFLPTFAIKYQFDKNGTLYSGANTTNKAVWKLNEIGNLLIGFDNDFTEYIAKTEKDTILILSIERNGKVMSYHFKKGW